MRNRVLVCVALIAFGVGLWMLAHTGGPPETAVAAMREAAIPGDPASPVAKAGPDAAASTPTAAPEGWRGWEQALLSSTNLRQFYEQALQQPERGGFFYANRALSHCRELRHASGLLPELQALATQLASAGRSPSEWQRLNDRREAVARLALRACDSFTDAELAMSHDGLVGDLVRDPRKPSDPWYGRSRDQVLQMVAGQPGWPTQLPPELAQHLVYWDLDGLYFDGQRYPSFLGAAMLDLLPCELGANCGPHDAVLAEACLHGLSCDAQERRDLVLRRLPEPVRTPEMVAVALTLAAHMGHALRTGAWEKFSPTNLRDGRPSAQAQPA